MKKLTIFAGFGAARVAFMQYVYDTPVSFTEHPLSFGISDSDAELCHPKFETQSGKNVAKFAAHEPYAVFCNSDYFIHGVRYGCLSDEFELIHSDVEIRFYAEDGDLTIITIDDNGKLSDYPHDFMDESLFSMSAIFALQRDKKIKKI